jgi:hypothetical protein
VGKDGKALDATALKALGKSLKGLDKELFKEITETKNHVTINTVDNDPKIDIAERIIPRVGVDVELLWIGQSS